MVHSAQSDHEVLETISDSGSIGIRVDHLQDSHLAIRTRSSIHSRVI